MKVAIVGSRGIADYDSWVLLLVGALKGLCVCEIVSGGASGVDSLAARYAHENGIPLVEFLPDYPRYGRAATLVRNSKIVDYADAVIAFPTADSKGTLDTIRKAEKAGKLLKIIRL